MPTTSEDKTKVWHGQETSHNLENPSDVQLVQNQSPHQARDNSQRLSQKLNAYNI